MLRLRAILFGVLLVLAAALAAAGARLDSPAPAKHFGTSSVPVAPSSASVAAVPPMTGAGAPAAIVTVLRAPVVAHQVTSPARVARGLATAPSYLHTFNLLI